MSNSGGSWSPSKISQPSGFGTGDSISPSTVITHVMITLPTTSVPVDQAADWRTIAESEIKLILPHPVNGRRTVGCMQDAAEIRGRKRRSSRAVLLGLSVIAFALLVSSWELAPPLATTIAAIAGFGIVMYGVHLGWLLFYDREPDGPSS
jgi:hypothetical protein